MCCYFQMISVDLKHISAVFFCISAGFSGYLKLKFWHLGLYMKSLFFIPDPSLQNYLHHSCNGTLPHPSRKNRIFSFNGNRTPCNVTYRRPAAHIYLQSSYFVSFTIYYLVRIFKQASSEKLQPSDRLNQPPVL